MNWKKFTFTLILGIIIILASFFMITESARYYTFFYESGAWQPLFLASLLEIFVLALAVMKIGTKRIFNFFQKFIMVSVFTVIITAAGIQAINPTLESLETVSQKESLSEILKDEYQNLKKDRDVFEKQKQRSNTAIAAAERRKIVNDLKDLFNQDIKTDKGRVALLNIIMLFTIRFIVQLANVFCASMLGVYFRGGKRQITSNKDVVLKIHPYAICKFLPQQKAHYVFKDSSPENRNSAGTLGRGLTPNGAWQSAHEKLKGK